MRFASLPNAPVISTPADTDAYKFSMAQYALHRAPTADVEYKFVNRSAAELRPLKDAIREQIDALAGLSFSDEEISYLGRHPWFSPDFLLFLKIFRFEPAAVLITEADGALDIRVGGPWLHRIFFEIHILAIVTELHFLHTVAAAEREAVFAAGLAKLREELVQVKAFVARHGAAKPFRLIEMGTRRRVSRGYQARVLDLLRTEIPEQLFGTSNVSFARELGLPDIGTMAHEFLQIHQQIGPRLENSQKAALEGWVQEFRGHLGIALTDVITHDAFLRDFDLYYAKLFDGVRHDSGDPFTFAEKTIRHFQNLGIDPAAKVAVFSDSLNLRKALLLCEAYEGRLRTSYGIGTALSASIPGYRALNVVMKPIRVNGGPVAKISDAPGKSICEDTRFLDYLRTVFDAQAPLTPLPLDPATARLREAFQNA
ncbi:MAG: nicotinate phosphoribosyltransferase [Verrucomicrobia bacterium]|nr:MAG: nicotinate phosphoribosyltransferase [Verrucomicrobiota bacterium]